MYKIKKPKLYKNNLYNIYVKNQLYDEKNKYN